MLKQLLFTILSFFIVFVVAVSAVGTAGVVSHDADSTADAIAEKEEWLPLFDGKTFSGKVCADARATALDREIQITGKAGSVCLMHTRLLHGSRANESGQARGLYICVYSAADAFPIARNPMPNPQEGMIVRGERSRVARLMEAEIELPEQPKSPSFFTVIGQDSAEGAPPLAEEDTR